MKHRFLLILLTSIPTGCSRPTADLVPTVEPPEAAVSSAVDADADPSAGLAPIETYPEKSEVTRLMYRANSEFEAGRYNEALNIVEQALQVDPTSVAAVQLKNRITNILVRS